MIGSLQAPPPALLRDGRHARVNQTNARAPRRRGRGRVVTMWHLQIGLCRMSGARCSFGGGGDGDEQDLCGVDIGGGVGEGIADPPSELRPLQCRRNGCLDCSCSYVRIACSWFKWSGAYDWLSIQNLICSTLTWLGLIIPRMLEIERTSLGTGRGNKSTGRPIGSSSGRIRSMQYRPLAGS